MKSTKKSSKHQFIENAKIVHNNEYDYSLVEYINSKTKVKIICPKHGLFEQRPNNHLGGQKCKLCINKNVKMNTLIFISRSKELYGDAYDYSLVEYINNKTKVKIICPKHGMFEQRPDNHLFNKKKFVCKRCYNENQLIEKEQIIERCKRVHNNYYDYSRFDYNGYNKKSIIVCPSHGEFKQTVLSHIMGSGCKICNNSKGENLISNILDNHNIKYYREKKFRGCKNIKPLKFDFWIPEINLCIEYNGMQHYKEIPFFGGSDYYKKIIKNDSIKYTFCEKNKVKLLTFRYDDTEENISKKILSLFTESRFI